MAAGSEQLPDPRMACIYGSGRRHGGTRSNISTGDRKGGINVDSTIILAYSAMLMRPDKRHECYCEGQVPCCDLVFAHAPKRGQQPVSEQGGEGVDMEEDEEDEEGVPGELLVARALPVNQSSSSSGHSSKRRGKDLPIDGSSKRAKHSE
jgi:hypothetical protein